MRGIDAVGKVTFFGLRREGAFSGLRHFPKFEFSYHLSDKSYAA